ncbi:MAG: UDP-N-acetylmuramoyl-L-alanine--D-glutamate ligase [Immundisolibacterales bacterium]|nr:UDP-N-acetylmuramoyl-L-alanine--D-glutamate ligase [Immundisolibacterales bacterium]
MKGAQPHGRTVVVGLGDSGLACARHLRAHGVNVAIADSRPAPPREQDARHSLPRVDIRLGAFDPDWFAGAVELVLSPGVSVDEPAVAHAAARGVPILGEVELFARAVHPPVVAVTGTNGKSTVCAWVRAMAEAHGLQATLGGNFGPPALTLLDSRPDLHVVELSSFQLETTRSLRPRVAALLNVSPDHLDRHRGFEAYRQAKARIFANAKTAVLWRDDPWLEELGARLAGDGLRVLTFSAERPGEGEYGLVSRSGRTWLARGREHRVDASELALPGRHNALNALAAMAIADELGIESAAVRRVLGTGPGLAHRCEPVGCTGGVRWYDDSKGTNVGATVAAVNGFDAPLVLIAGGDGKGADFRPLGRALRGSAERIREVVLLGRDAPAIRTLIEGHVPVSSVGTMAEAVSRAREAARPGDAVLLSPACASWDMYRDYRERGRDFRALVQGSGTGGAA